MHFIRVKILLLVLVSIGYCYGTNAQSVDYLQSYFPSIHKAEMALIDGNFVQAYGHYQSAFEANHGFVKDYFNAAACAALMGETQKVYSSLLKVAAKGLSLDFVKNEKAFRAIQRDDNWRSFELEYLEAKRTFDRNLDHELKSRLNSWVDTYRSTSDSINRAKVALEFYEYINEHGFPSENEIGIGEGGYPLIALPFYEILKDNLVASLDLDITSLFRKAIKKGAISPHMASYLLRQSTGNDELCSRHVYKIKTPTQSLDKEQKSLKNSNQWVYPIFTQDDERSIDELRLNFGLDNLADYRRKIWFSLQDQPFLLPYKIFASQWYLTDPKLANQYLENTALLKEER